MLHSVSHGTLAVLTEKIKYSDERCVDCPFGKLGYWRKVDAGGRWWQISREGKVVR